MRGTSYQPPGGHVYYILEPARAADEPKLTASGKWHHKENRTEERAEARKFSCYLLAFLAKSFFARIYIYSNLARLIYVWSIF